MELIRQIPIWRKVTHCPFDALSDMRLEAYTDAPNQRHQNFWLNKKAGTIKLDCGVHTLGFGLELDEAEARKVINTIGAVFPELRA